MKKYDFEKYCDVYQAPVKECEHPIGLKLKCTECGKHCGTLWVSREPEYPAELADAMRKGKAPWGWCKEGIFIYCCEDHKNEEIRKFLPKPSF